MSGFSITDGTSVFSFAPEFGFKDQGFKDENKKRAKSGALFTYKFHSVAAWKVPVLFVSAADANTINGWWDDNVIVSFNGDILSGVFSCYITNKKTPISSLIKPYDDLYKGTIELQET